MEDVSLAVDMAGQLKEYAECEGVDFYFKASYDKANRTREDSYRGPGISSGLKILDEVKIPEKYWEVVSGITT